MTKQILDGIILVLSCQKHLHTRLKQFSLPKDTYGEWKVVYVIGDLFLESDYTITGNLMVIKCEDSYIHLLKKLVLALKYVYELYDIKEGVLRSGDDLIFNEVHLQSFLSLKNKDDFMGKVQQDISTELLQGTRDDSFMINYYMTHIEDFNNPHHNLMGVDITKYTKRPNINAVGGVLYYISNICCKVLIGQLESINFDIFHFDDDTQSYPYTIEDCAVSFILFKNMIGLTHVQNMYSDIQSDSAICVHTNLYR